MSKICKSLDLNKLFEQQDQGKLLKKHMKFPILGSIKYDGNYVTVEVGFDKTIFTTSGGHVYVNNAPTIFDTASYGVYLAERIGKDGKLGDRVNCALRGTKTKPQVAYGHKYMVHDMLTLEGYAKGLVIEPFIGRELDLIVNSNLDMASIVHNTLLHNQEEVEAYLKEVVAKGYEGIMLKSPSWAWADTKSRRVDNVKYKKRPTADLKCIGITMGAGKYEGMIGALILKDSEGREVQVGSGLDDYERSQDYTYFADKVIEVEYEQILDTYIQPTFICIRHDKNIKDID